MKTTIIVLLMILTSCTSKLEKTPVFPSPERLKLSWEKGHPERQAWSDTLVAALAQKIPDMSKAKDIKTFCPKFELLEPIQKTRAFAELMIGMAKFESNWKPETSYRECSKTKCVYGSGCFKHPTYGYCMKGNPKYDGGVVTSRGLLQMSISSSLSYGCELKDSSDLHDVAKNLKCAVIILDKQIKRTGSMTDRSNYWSTLKSTYSKNHIKEISSMVQANVSQCK
jgi:hypothetical protein